eukprot:12240218-Prorocentrum_lima.AAC.1
MVTEVAIDTSDLALSGTIVVSPSGTQKPQQYSELVGKLLGDSASLDKRISRWTQINPFKSI